MRFRNFHPHKVRAEERTQEAELRAQRAAVEVEKQAERAPERKGSIPIEWQPLSRFIEAGRNVRPEEEYTRCFWSRLLPRLRVIAHKDEMVREYLRETLWWRWSMRAAAAIVFAAMAYGLYTLHSDNRQLASRVVRLEQQVQTLQAGM